MSSAKKGSPFSLSDLRPRQTEVCPTKQKRGAVRKNRPRLVFEASVYSLEGHAYRQLQLAGEIVLRVNHAERTAGKIGVRRVEQG